jgi:hypothetical protein
MRAWLEALTCEVQTAALQTAAVTSAVNVLDTPAPLEDPKSVGGFVPAEPVMFLLSRMQRGDEVLTADTVAELKRYFSVLAQARHVIAGYLADLDAIGPGHAAILHASALRHAWRRACRSGLAAVKAVADDVEAWVPECYTATTPVLSSILNGAAAGFHPCVDVTGRIYLPELPQRRRAPRTTLLQPCEVRTARRRMSAIVRDVSSGGIGLDRVPGLAPADLVTIDMETGRRFVGTVMWVDGSRAGIRFGTSLAPNDPIIFG